MAETTIKVYDGDKLIIDAELCRDNTGEVGWYDHVGKKFHPTPLPETTGLQWIDTGVQYIDTGCVPASLRAKGEWISVEEKRPKDRQRCFIAYKFDGSEMRFFGEAMFHAYEGNGLVDRPHFSNEGLEGMYVTHWMAIPKLPNCGADMRTAGASPRPTDGGNL